MKTVILALLILVTSCTNTDIVFKYGEQSDGDGTLYTYVWYKGELVTTYRDIEDIKTRGCNTNYCFVSLIDSAVIAKRHAQGMALINALRSADKLINELEK